MTRCKNSIVHCLLPLTPCLYALMNHVFSLWGLVQKSKAVAMVTTVAIFLSNEIVPIIYWHGSELT